MVDSPRAPASLRFKQTTTADDRLREQWKNDRDGMAYRHAAVSWVTRRLSGPVDESAELVAGSAWDPDEARADWRALREGLGELEQVKVMACEDIGPLAAAAGSYEPEVHGRGPGRVRVTLTAIGSIGEADLVLVVPFPGGPAVLSRVSLEGVHARAKPPPPPPPTPEELELERLSLAICDAPDDDEPRAQIAALWTALGEPRGEFVRAQLAGDEARAQALRAQHGQHWTDGLPVARDGRVYRRGFLAEARVECSARDLHATIDSPAWNLLTGLHLGVMQFAQPPFMKHARLGSLRRLTGIWADTIERTPLPRQVTHLSIRGTIYECPERLVALEIVTYFFESLWVFARQHKHPHLALLSVSARRELASADLLVIQGLLAEPRPARLVLINRGEEDVELWRLEVTDDGWYFTGDERVLQQLRDATTLEYEEL